MKEFDLISRLCAGLPSNETVKVGPGHDCAVLDLGIASELLLFKTDAVVEGVHFEKESPAGLVGRKALARCLSDIAAMAGTPKAALVTLGLPVNYDPDRIEAIYSGMSEVAARYQVAIAGGETSTNPERIFISIALLGTVPRGRVITRGGTQSGDAIFVTGTLGGSLAGRHLDFEPRLAEAQWLAAQFPIHSMMDLSDGLAGDLKHILKASGVGAELLASAIPISREARLRARQNSHAKPPLLAALTDGEDFELLFTVPSTEAVRLLDAWKSQFPSLKLSCIGRARSTPGLALRDKQGVREITEHGYTHHA